MKLKLTKKKAEEFSKALCGTAKGLTQYTSNYDWVLNIGYMKYDFWLLSGRIYCQIAVGCHVVASYYFNYETLEPDFEFTDDDREKWRDKELKQDRLEFLLWMRDSSEYKVNIPDVLIEKYVDS